MPSRGLDLLLSYARQLRHKGDHEGALKVLDTVLSDHPSCPPARAEAEDLRSALVPGWHFAMLNDSARNAAYRAALRGLLVGRESVVDVGAGSGLLSLYAAEALRRAPGNASSNRRVVACEANAAMADVAAEVVGSCGLADAVQVLPRLSVELDFSDDPFDVMVTETFDAGLLGEHCLDIFDHAWKKLLHERSKIVPASATVYCFICESDAIRKRNVFSNRKIGALDTTGLTLVKAETVEEPYDCERLNPSNYRRLSPDQSVAAIDFYDKALISSLRSEGSKRELEIVVGSFGRLDAVLVWFRLQLDETTALSTNPEEGECEWQQALFPIRNSFDVRQGDVVDVTFRVKGHLELLSCSKRIKDEAHSNGCNGENSIETKTSQIDVPEKLLQEVHDDSLLREYERIAGKYSEEKELDILDCQGFGGLLSLQMLKCNPRAQAGFLFDDPTTYAAKTDFLFGIGERNGLVRPQERIHCEFPASLDEQTDFDYNVVVWNPVGEGGMFEVTGSMRQCLERGIKKKSQGSGCKFLPRKLTIWCRLFKCAKIRDRFRVNETNLSLADLGQHLAQAVNRFSPTRLRDLNYAVDFEGVEFVSANTRITSIEACQGLEDVQLQFDFESVSPGEADGVMYWGEMDYGHGVTIHTWSENSQRSSFKQAAFLFDKSTAVNAHAKGTFLFQSGLMEINLT